MTVCIACKFAVYILVFSSWFELKQHYWALAQPHDTYDTLSSAHGAYPIIFRVNRLFCRIMCPKPACGNSRDVGYVKSASQTDGSFVWFNNPTVVIVATAKAYATPFPNTDANITCVCRRARAIRPLYPVSGGVCTIWTFHLPVLTIRVHFVMDTQNMSMTTFFQVRWLTCICSGPQMGLTTINTNFLSYPGIMDVGYDIIC